MGSLRLIPGEVSRGQVEPADGVEMAQLNHPTESAVAGLTPNVPGGDHVSCFSCGNPQLTSVRAIFEQGTSVTDVTSVGGAVGFDGDGGISPAVSQHSTTFATSSVLAQRLSPPEQPTFRDSAWARPHSYAAVGGILPACLLIGAFTVGGVPVIWILLSVVWLVAVVATTFPLARVRERLRSEYEGELRRWEVSLADWAELRYCSSCDSVTDPRTGKGARADDLYCAIRAA